MYYKTGIAGKNYKIYSEYYDSISDLLNTCDSRQCNTWADYNRGKNDSYDTDFTGGCKKYEDAVNLLKFGWKDKVEEIKKSYEKFTKDTQVKGTTIITSPVGFMPVVPNFIMGLPNSMMNVESDEKKSKIIDLMVDFGVCWRTKPAEVIEKGVKLLAKIASLERSGYRVRLSASKAFTSTGDKKAYICNLLLKSEYQPLDIQRIAFPLFHPAMFRIIMFDWYERIPNAVRFSGYGESLGVSDMQKEVIDYEKKDNQLLIHFGSDLDKVFEQYK
jgi:hypothetical protein